MYESEETRLRLDQEARDRCLEATKNRKPTEVNLKHLETQFGDILCSACCFSMLLHHAILFVCQACAMSGVLSIQTDLVPRLGS